MKKQNKDHAKNDEQVRKLAEDLQKKSEPFNSGYLHGIDVRNAEHLKYPCPMESLNYELMGGVNMKQLDRLRVTLKVTRHPQLSPVHAYRNTVDLYSDSQIKRYVRESAEKLELGTTDLTNTIYSLIDGLEKYRLQKRKEQLIPQRPPEIKLSKQSTKEALELLENPNLLPQLSELFSQAGLVGEEKNGLLLFLIFLTRNFDHPLHALVHGSSGSGKTNLLKAIIACVPDEQKHITTALTENVLFYPPYKSYWKHKILMLEDLDGSMNALYSIREFMSNGNISKDTTEMSQQTGEHQGKRLEVEGPVCIVGATTKDKLYEDNSNRSYLLHVDESYKHQGAVMNYQNEIAAGLVDKDRIEQIQQLIKNMQRLLTKIEVRNPFQPELILPQVVFKPLRTNQHYISLIKAITFLHQSQLEVQEDEKGRKYIETTLNHIEWANKLCRESLLRKSDQLSGGQRTFFERLKTYLNEQGITEKDNKTFFVSDVRKHFKIHPETCKRNFKTLEKHGLLVQINYTKKQGYEYELLEWNDYSEIVDSINTMDNILKELREKYPRA